MSTTAMSTTAHRKQKQKEAKVQHVPNGAERLKTVVRRLPPNLPEDVFWQSVQAWVSDDTVTWRSYCPGKWRTKRLNKEGTPSRAYIAFKNEEQVAAFSREYDGHVFRDKAGNESQAVVEFAPFQKVPTDKKKVDARNNTIDKDEDYLSFIESLKGGPKTEIVPLEALVAASQPPPPPTTTPLLEALKAEKSAQKDRETILRNHAHYKDAGGSASKKEEAKKKPIPPAAAAKQQQQQPDSVPSSKKVKKAAAAAAQKANSTVDGQGPGPSLPAKGHQPAGAAPSTAKPSTPASVASRHRTPKDTHGRTHGGKGDAATPLTATAGPKPATAENASQASPASPPPGPSSRKSRPTIGLGRQFEAALSGTGVGVASGSGPVPAPGSGNDRKKRDKGAGESGHGVEGGGRGKHGEHLAAVVPSILQRSEGGQTDVAMAQRPLSPRVEGPGPGPGAVHGEGGGGGGPPTRGGRRGRGRGRGAPRGG